MGSFISWLDHSEDDQRRVREMLQLFSDKDTVDDLGIGTVRDAISNSLFPGTSVIQTRARYFLFVPWLYRRAEEQHPRSLVAKAADMERSLVGALQAGGDRDGLIGAEVGKNVRTLPSAIFWGGLIRYGIFLVPSLSIRQYGRHVSRGYIALDPEDEMADRPPSFWNREIPDPPPDFFRFQTAAFSLTRDEAEWLSERVISADPLDRRASLLTAFIRDLRRGQAPPAGDSMWDASLPGDTPVRIADLVRHAERFSCAVNGAALLYNLLLAEERSVDLGSGERTSVDTYRELLGEWRDRATGLKLPDWAQDIDDFWDCVLSNAVRIPPATHRFVDAWSRVLIMDGPGIISSAAARGLIKTREIEHKRGQARLANSKRLAEWTGHAGTTPPAFRWPQVRRMLRDIAAGLGEFDTGDSDAVA